MTEHVHSGPHLDSESLSAFVEGALPEHERLICMTHIAECSRCREIAFLSQSPEPAATPATVTPVTRRWFPRVPIFGGALAASALIVAVSLYRSQTPVVPTEIVAARAKPAPPSSEEPPQTMPSRESKAPKPSPLRAFKSPAPFSPPKSAETASALGRLDAASPAVVTPPLQAPPAAPSEGGGSIVLSIEHDRVATSGLSEVKGSVTDASGASIPGATVTIHQLAASVTGTALTDSKGQFTMPPLPAGRYELEVVSPGFQRTSAQLELQPQDLALVASTLAVGSLSQTVEVTASASPTIEAPTVATTGLFDTGRPATLSNNQPFATSVMNGKRILRVDSTGALYFSRNAGKHWKSVKPQWQGKVKRITVSAEPPDAATTKAAPSVFQVTTDADAVWLSADGIHWHPAVSRR